MIECRLILCVRPVAWYVRHPYRPEERTALCARHAATATAEIEAARVVSA